jgi:hypothetical protein
VVAVTERRLHFKKESTPILTSHFGRVYFFDEPFEILAHMIDVEFGKDQFPRNLPETEPYDASNSEPQTDRLDIAHDEGFSQGSLRRILR